VQEVKEDNAANRGCPREGAVLVTHWTFRREKASLREFHRPAMPGATRATQVGKLNDHCRGKVARLADDQVNVTVGLELRGVCVPDHITSRASSEPNST
jgi:hypothetical protein